MSEEVIEADPSTSVIDAAKLLREKNRGSVLVKEEEKTLGIVTNSDIINKFVAEEKGNSIEEIMSEELVTVSPTKTVEEAAAKMVEEGVERLLVAENGDILGVISTNDIIKVQPSLYLNLTQGLKLGQEKFEISSSESGQCESCENYSENLKEVNGNLLCEVCREEMNFA